MSALTALEYAFDQMNRWCTDHPGSIAAKEFSIVREAHMAGETDDGGADEDIERVVIT
jgi:hypothetical protein